MISVEVDDRNESQSPIMMSDKSEKRGVKELKDAERMPVRESVVNILVDYSVEDSID